MKKRQNLEAELKAMLPQKKSKAYYAKKLGISVLEVNNLFYQIKGTKNPPSTLTTARSGEGSVIDFSAGKGEITKIVSEPIKTLEQLIKQCDIDTQVWKIDKYVQNFWGSATNPSYQVKAFLSKRAIDNDPKLQKEFILNELKNTPIKRWYSDTKIPKWMLNPNKHGKYLFELSLPDIHVGKLGWAEESGEDYDIAMAVKRYKAAVKKLLTRVNISEIEKILLPVGNDLIQIDNAENQTTRGTTVDTDGRFPKIFRAAKDMLIEVIEELSIIAPVEILVVRGNHDYQTTFLMGEVLEAWFRNDKKVNVENCPKGRKYYQYGKVGIQYTHGDKEKHADLGQLFAHEEPKLWADTLYRFCKLGHFHKNKKTNKPTFKDIVTLDTFTGFQVQILPSLSGPDEWHFTEGFISIKQGKAFLYDREEGEVGEYTMTVV